jgi:hypothetical protein
MPEASQGKLNSVEDNQASVDFTFAGAIRGKIERWLNQEGWTVEPRSGEGVVWALLAVDRLKRRLLISQHRGHEDRVLLEARVVPSQEQAERLADAASTLTTDLMWDIRFELNRMGIDFQGVNLPFHRAVLTEAIYFEGAFDSGLAKDTFFQRIEHIRRGIAMVQFLLQRRLIG